ncbi:MAG: septum formation initiator family protein [Erythrobacter sp.]|nr:MAG: septum formation initiator family protein [Erythrobacter sp.]
MNIRVTRREAVREKLVNGLALLVLVLIALLALMGPSGLLAWTDHAAKLEQYHARIATLEEERAVLANRVDLLHPDHVDPDLASELARRDLNVAHKDEFIYDLEPVR